MTETAIPCLNKLLNLLKNTQVAAQNKNFIGNKINLKKNFNKENSLKYKIVSANKYYLNLLDIFQRDQ